MTRWIDRCREVDEFPVENGESEHATLGELDYDAILEAVIAVCDQPERCWVKTQEVDVTATRAGSVLTQLEAAGLVRRHGTTACTQELWRPTTEGRHRVATGGDGT